MLSAVDLSASMARADYKKKLAKLQARLHRLGYEAYLQKVPVAIVFEGWDASGKGGAIKRLREKIDPRGIVVWQIGAPSGDDKDRHYLYRFWRRLPEAGQIAIFDRSWYGRVLVERVERFAAAHEWRRAYGEINQFERSLTRFGMVVLKFWLHIDRKEQLRRFAERAATSYKSFKLTDEDWRNRGRWSDYEKAAEEMLRKTGTRDAPWTVVEANDKLFARIKVLDTVADRLSARLG